MPKPDVTEFLTTPKPKVDVSEFLKKPSTGGYLGMKEIPKKVGRAFEEVGRGLGESRYLQPIEAGYAGDISNVIASIERNLGQVASIPFTGAGQILQGKQETIQVPEVGEAFGELKGVAQKEGWWKAITKFGLDTVVREAVALGITIPQPILQSALASIKLPPISALRRPKVAVEAPIDVAPQPFTKAPVEAKLPLAKPTEVIPEGKIVVGQESTELERLQADVDWLRKQGMDKRAERVEQIIESKKAKPIPGQEALKIKRELGERLRARQATIPPTAKVEFEALRTEYLKGQEYDPNTPVGRNADNFAFRKIQEKYPQITRFDDLYLSKPEGGTTLYSGINPQEILNTIKSIVPEKPKGVEIQAPATPELHSAYVAKMPQNVFKDIPEAAKVVYEVRQTERSFAIASQRAFEQVPTLLKLKDPIKDARLRRIAENWSELENKGLIEKFRVKNPEGIKAVEEYRGLMGSYQQRMWKELKQAGYKVPDKVEEWGIEDYVSHAQYGNYLVKANNKVVGVTGNRIQAYEMAQDWVDKHPTAPKPVITGKDFVPSEAIAFVSGKQKRAILTAFNRQLDIPYAEAARLLKGVISKTPKRRFAGIRMQRIADMPLPRNTTLSDRTRFYVATAERFLHYNKLRRVGQKLIDKVPPSPYKVELQDYFKSIEQPPSTFELTIDQKLQKIPVLGDYVRPFFLRRRIGNITNAVAVLKLAVPRFWV